MKPKLKKPKFKAGRPKLKKSSTPIPYFTAEFRKNVPFVVVEGKNLSIKKAIALRKWLGEAVRYLKQEAKKK